MANANLVSVPTLVESPFIIVTIGGCTFGSYMSTAGGQVGLYQNVTFPNYMKSLSITKVNGTVNTYTLCFSYQVAHGQDPNLLDKVFSRASIDRKITLSYGDWNFPSYIYKEETGIITSVTTNLNMGNSSIDYTVKCTSDAIGLTATSFNFPARKAKPSDVLKEMIGNVRYGLKEVFTGMQNENTVLSANMIASNDKKVQLNAQPDATPLEYMNYLVNSMIDVKNTDDTSLPQSSYFMTIHDDVDNEYGGTYFTVKELTNDGTLNNDSADTYVLDVNYPTDNFITQFSLVNDQSWAILYEYSDRLSEDNYSYKLNSEGKVVTTYSPILTRSAVTKATSPAASNWWSRMTSFPVQATLTLKGLTRPSMLMSYVRLNVWFSGGNKHVSSGLYIITKQEDKLDSSGYKTTLTLLRVGGDA